MLWKFIIDDSGFCESMTFSQTEQLDKKSAILKDRQGVFGRCAALGHIKPQWWL